MTTDSLAKHSVEHDYGAISFDAPPAHAVHAFLADIKFQDSEIWY